MLKRERSAAPDLRIFDNLPVQHVTVGDAGEWLAVHITGELGADQLPLVCIPGYQRNMTDFADFAHSFGRVFGADWPVVLLDLKGRGRSAYRSDKGKYISTVDAHEVQQGCAALGIGRAVFVGQGYGGQIIMALAAQAPLLVAGAVLIDAGPVSDPRGLVRLRNNLRELEGQRSAAGLRNMFRRILATDYPGLQDGMLDVLAARTHSLDERGRVHALFDNHLVRMLDAFEHDDVLVAQWPLFNALTHTPLMMMRTQLTEQLRREVFEEMMRRRRDADAYIIEGQASPALLNTTEDVAPIAEFVRKVLAGRQRAVAQAAVSAAP
ncbi:MAG TPA: alpha/beta hydrolase [Devosiaceae bacterium]|jgi:pimeloyl-ACP methyl ester carboxylesterase|nr:alpha/beta hydrolase [Devosiaceae bacterium]